MDEASYTERSDDITLIEDGVLIYKKLIIYILMIALALTIAALTFSLVWAMVQILIDQDLIIIDKVDVLTFLGIFLLIIIAIELMDTLIIYTRKNVVKVEIVILVAITAAARELIVQDYERVEPFLLMGIGGILVASAITYYLVRKARIESHTTGVIDEAE